MTTAYTPGLTVSAHTLVRRTRRLPLKGEVLVNAGDEVSADTPVARTELPGAMQTVRVAERLGAEPGDLPRLLKVKLGDRVAEGDLLAETAGLFGRFMKSSVQSPCTGTVELISETSGHVGIREAPAVVQKTAYMRGRVAEVLPGEGVVVATTGALVQGIFGVGGERQGALVPVGKGPGLPVDDGLLNPECAGMVVFAGQVASRAVLDRCTAVGVAALVCGAIVDTELMAWLADVLNQPGYDIGVAITGQEATPFSIVVTEGFGAIDMAQRTWDLLMKLAGSMASVNGATQIRAGVIRPEIVVPSTAADELREAPAASTELAEGVTIRIIREPAFGRIARVTGLPPELVRLESGAEVRVLEAQLQDGTNVVVPRANVEIVDTSGAA